MSSHLPFIHCQTLWKSQFTLAFLSINSAHSFSSIHKVHTHVINARLFRGLILNWAAWGTHSLAWNSHLVAFTTLPPPSFIAISLTAISWSLTIECWFSPGFKSLPFLLVHVYWTKLKWTSSSILKLYSPIQLWLTKLYFHLSTEHLHPRALPPHCVPNKTHYFYHETNSCAPVLRILTGCNITWPNLQKFSLCGVPTSTIKALATLTCKFH